MPKFCLRIKGMKRTQKRIIAQLEELPKFLDSNLNYIIYSLLNQRLSNLSVRSYFIFKMHNYIDECMKEEKCLIKEEETDFFSTKIPFIGEIVMTIIYMDNHLLDNKFGVHEDKKSIDHLLGKNLLKNFLYDYVDKNFHFEEAFLIRKTLTELFLYVDLGQWLDKTYNNYASFKKDVGPINLNPQLDKFAYFGNSRVIIDDLKKEYPEKENYIELYFTRIFLSTASFFYHFSKLLMELKGYNGKHFNHILHFSCIHGIMRQIVNDNTDFIQHSDGTATKKGSDFMSDLKNGTITLPLIFQLCSENADSSLTKEVLENKNDIKGREEEILDELIQSKAILKSMKIARVLTSSQGSRPYLDGNFPSAHHLNSFSSIAFNNKFYHSIYKRRHYLQKREMGAFC